MNEILQVAISNGLWATLFVFLLFYQLKDSATREKKYQQTISSLAENKETLTHIKGNISEIKESSEVSGKNIEKIKNEVTAVNKKLLEVKKEVVKHSKIATVVNNG